MKNIKKENLPSKLCVHCGLPFSWRKKWQLVWDEVKYCSERCRRAKKELPSKVATQGIAK